MTKMMCMIVC